MPVELEPEVLSNLTEVAMDYIQDEQARAGGSSGTSSNLHGQGVLSDGDLDSLRKRLPFLADFSDAFIRSRPMESILKIETTSLKIRQMEQSRDHEDRLAINKMALESTMMNIPAGQDNRWSTLHKGR
jgi:hypothetical protein